MSITTTPDGRKRVTLIAGDGIGAEVVGAARRLVDASGAKIAWEEAEAGAAVFKKGNPTGVPPETIESLRRTRVALKGPLETPIGYGEKSANVTLRKLFETFANLRPVREMPGVPTPYTGRGIDLIMVRENVEDLYAGIEHMQTPGVAQCLKLITRKGCEKIARMAFAVALAEGRRKVTCATKANIMKLTEGMLKRVFEEVAKEYPQIQAEHLVVDNAAHQLVKRPEQFDVIVTTNMNGDILSDLSSGLIGGLGFAPSANIGNGIAIFEAVHGSAPKYAGKDVINPTAEILTAVMMLRYLGEFDAAAKIEHAVLVTLEDGKVMPRDVVGDAKAAGTKRFTEEILANFGRTAKTTKVRDYRPLQVPEVGPSAVPVAKKSRVIGVDLFVQSGDAPEALGPSLEEIVKDLPVRLSIIANRGTRVYPPTGASTDCADHHQCRFRIRKADGDLDDAAVFDLLKRVAAKHRWTHVEKLWEYNGAAAFTKVQGEE